MPDDVVLLLLVLVLVEDVSAEIVVDAAGVGVGKTSRVCPLLLAHPKPEYVLPFKTWR